MIKPVLLIRSENNEVDSFALGKLGIPSIVDPYVEIRAVTDQSEGVRLFQLLRSSIEPLWVIATSRNAIHHWVHIVGEEQFRSELQTRKNVNFAAVGEATADTLRHFGAPVVFIPSHPNAETLADELVLLTRQSHALIPGGNLAMPNLPLILRNSGWIVNTAEVYRSLQVSGEPHSADMLRKGEFSAVLLRSPSAVDALVHFVPRPVVPLVCAGSTTASSVYAHGLKVGAISSKPTPEIVASTIHSLIFH